MCFPHRLVSCCLCLISYIACFSSLFLLMLRVFLPLFFSCCMFFLTSLLCCLFSFFLSPQNVYIPFSVLYTKGLVFLPFPLLMSPAFSFPFPLVSCRVCPLPFYFSPVLRVPLSPTSRLLAPFLSSAVLPSKPSGASNLFALKHQ